MAILRFEHSRVIGLTCTFPRHEVATATIAEQLGVNPQRVLAMTGIERRRIAPPHLCASDLCADAAGRLLDALGWAPESVGALLFVSQTPDFFTPATACVLQQRLGLPQGCACFDINLGCSGYVYGLSVASSLVESGIERALLLVGDTTSRMVSELDRSVAFLFGDAGSATALERKPARSTYVLGTDGGGAPHLIIPAGQARQKFAPELCARVEQEGGSWRSPVDLYMNGAEVAAFTLREVPPLFERLLAESGVRREELDALLLHQANQFLLDNLARKLGMDPARVPSSLRAYGNTSCASIPVTLTACLRETVAASPQRLAMMGFGVGWSWAACVGEYGPLVAPPANYLN